MSSSPASAAAAPQSAPPPPQLLSGVYRDYRQNRISLLHPEYGPGGRAATGGAAIQPAMPATVCIGDGGARGGDGQQPLKKIRLQDKEGLQPLRIDTRVGFASSC